MGRKLTGLGASVDSKDKKSVPWEPSASIINTSGLLFYHKCWAGHSNASWVNTVIGILLLLHMKKISGEGVGIGLCFKISYTLGKYCFLQFKQIPSVTWSYKTLIYIWDEEVNTIELSFSPPAHLPPYPLLQTSRN